MNYYNATENLDFWKDGSTYYVNIDEFDGKPMVTTYDLTDYDHPHGLNYGPYMKIFTGYGDERNKTENPFYYADASHYVAANSKDMKYTVHAQVGFRYRFQFAYSSNFELPSLILWN